MRAVGEYRQADAPAGPLRLLIVSAGLGLLDEQQAVRSYDMSFTGLRKAEIEQRAQALGLPAALAEELRLPRTLTIVALGEAYLEACGINAVRGASAPVVVLTGERGRQSLPATFLAITLTTPDTKRFRAGFVGLKGAVVSRLLGALVDDPTLAANPTRLTASVERGAP